MTVTPRLPTARPPRAALLALVALSSWAAPACAQRATPARPSPAVAARPVDWDALRDEAVGTLQAYLRINTTNPPGNELAAARWLAGVLQQEGIEARVLDTTAIGPGRANVWARLPGSGASGRRAVALMHHLDVVPADGTRWTMPPFADVDVRLLPGDDAGAVLAELRRVVDDTLVRVEVVGAVRPVVPPAPFPGPVADALARTLAALRPGVPIVPLVLAGASDAPTFAAAGVPVYGVVAHSLEPAAWESMHGDDERVSLAQLETGLRFLVRLLYELDRPAGDGPPTSPRP